MSALNLNRAHLNQNSPILWQITSDTYHQENPNAESAKAIRCCQAPGRGAHICHSLFCNLSGLRVNQYRMRYCSQCASCLTKQQELIRGIRGSKARCLHNDHERQASIKKRQRLLQKTRKELARHTEAGTSLLSQWHVRLGSCLHACSRFCKLVPKLAQFGWPQSTPAVSAASTF